MTECNNGVSLISREDAPGFFQRNFLQPGMPMSPFQSSIGRHNPMIISIWGGPGVGKTRLLRDLKDMADRQDHCLTALIDGTQKGLDCINVMRQIAVQLSDAGHPFISFMKELDDYEEEQHNIPVNQDPRGEAIVQDATHIAEGVVKSVGGPLGQAVVPIISPSVDLTERIFMKKLDEQRRFWEANRLSDQIGDLTYAFVADLNKIVQNKPRTIPGRLVSDWSTPKQKIILFFTAFDNIADNLSPWLLHYFLKSMLDENKTFARDYVVLVIASYQPIGNPEDMAERVSWQNAAEIIPIHLELLSPEETRRFLEGQGIHDPAVIASLSAQSQGLLSLLTKPDLRDQTDLTKDVVDNYLQAFSEEQKNIALVAALLSRPFNQDDLTAFSSWQGNLKLPSLQDVASIYQWLTSQTFVRRLPDGRYSYTSPAKECFGHYLYQISTDTYYEVRHYLADYYQKRLEKMHQEQGEDVYDTGVWLELIRALVYQLFFLPDLKSHVEAVVLIFDAYVHVRRTEGVIGILEDLSKESFYDSSNQAPKLIANLHQCITASLASQDFLNAHTFLLNKVADVPEEVFPKDNLAYIYYQRGLAYFALHKYTQASVDLNQAIEDLNESIKLNPNDVWAYVLRGLAHLWLKDIEAAINDYTCGPHSVRCKWMVEWIGMSQAQKAFAEIASRLDQIADSDDQPPLVPACRAAALWLRQDFPLALATLEQALTQNHNPYTWDLHFWQGITYACLRRDEEAVAALEQALVLGLPPVLLTTLHWLERDRSDFYEQHAKPMLARYA